MAPDAAARRSCVACEGIALIGGVAHALDAIALTRSRVAWRTYDSSMESQGTDHRLELLRRVPLFSALESDELAAVAAITEERDEPAGVTLTTEGRHEGYFYAIASGSVRIERGGRTIATLGDGDFLGEIALLDGGPRTATAVTDSACRLLVMTQQRFWRLLQDAPEIREAVLEEVGRRLRLMDSEAPH
jgi:signal-transduction protein with cAMP-binding, CBS, and nucleotidyltransferase domain